MDRSGASGREGGDNAPESGSPRTRGDKYLFLLLLLLAFVEGASIMVIELTAARLMTPYFGQSVFVWTNIIGIILAAVAVGNYFGGRWADKSRTLAPLFLCFFLCGLFCLFAPLFIQTAATYFLGDGLHLEDVFVLLIRGSFCTALLLFAPPVLLAGASLPFLVKAASEACGGVGRGSGSVYGISTTGSIAGTFLSTYLFIELLGSKNTFFATGILLMSIAAMGMLVVKRARIRAGGVLLLLLLAGAMAWARPSPGFHGDEGLLLELESRYQYLRAVKVSDQPETIHLCINEGLDSFHSIYVKDQILTGEQYYDYYCLLPALAGMAHPDRVCIIGLAAGTIARQYTHFFQANPALKIDGVELDARTVEVGRRFMDLDYTKEVLTTYNDRDGRMFLSTPGPAYDVIILDAYAKQIYIPFHMTTRTFFEQVHDRLKEGGIMGMNVSGFSHDDRLLKAIANTAASVFDSIFVARVPGGRNFMLYGLRGERGDFPHRIRLPDSLEPLAILLQNISTFGVTREVQVDSEGILLTDDRAPVELLCDDDLLGRSLDLIRQVERAGP